MAIGGNATEANFTPPGAATRAPSTCYYAAAHQPTYEIIGAKLQRRPR
jgi:hypothetical protein